MPSLLLAALLLVPPAPLPQSYAALFAQGHAHLDARRLPEAQRDLEAALALRPENANCAYALACTSSAAGDLPRAAQWLKTATDWGYDDPAVAAWDPDLEALRKTVAWKELLAAIEQHSRVRPSEASKLQFDWRLDGVYTVFSPDCGRLLIGRSGHGYLYGLQESELISVLSRTGEFTSNATFTEDGRYILRTAHEDKLEIWDGVTGRFLRELEPPGLWEGVLLPCCGDRVLGYGGGPKGSIAIWELATGKLAMKLPTEFVEQAAVSPDGRLAVVVEDPMGKPTRVEFLDLEHGTSIARHEDCGRPMFDLEFSPDGALVLAMSMERSRPVIYDGRTGAELRTLDEHGGRVRFAHFLNRSSALLIQTEEGQLQWIDPRTGNVQRSIEIGKRAWGGMGSDPTGKSILLSEAHEPWDGGARLELFDADTGASRWRRDRADDMSWMGSAAFSPDGELLLLPGSDDRLEIVETQTGRSLREIRAPARELLVRATTDPRSCIVGTVDGTVARVDLASGRALSTHEFPGARLRLLLAGPGGRTLVLREDGQASILAGDDLDQACVLADVQPLASQRHCEAQFRPDGERVAFWAEGQQLLVSNTKSGAREQPLGPGTKSLAVLDWSNDGRWIAAADPEGSVLVLDASTGAPVGEPIRPGVHSTDGTRPWTVARFSPDARQLAVGFEGPAAHVYERESGKLLLELSHKDDDWDGELRTGEVAYSPDGSVIVTTTMSFGSVHGWDAKTGQRLWRFEYGGGNPSPLHVRFDPVGARLCTYGMGWWTPRVVDAKTGATLVDLKDAGLNQLEFSADGSRLVASTGTSLKVLRASDGALLFERVEVMDGGAFLHSASMHVDGSAVSLRRIQVLFGGESFPLDALATVLLDPKRVRAAAAGVSVAPAIVPVPPTVELQAAAGKKLVARGSCAAGMLGFEVELDGQPLDTARVREATKIEDEGRRASLELALDGLAAAGSGRIRVSAVARSGIASRPSFTRLQATAK